LTLMIIITYKFLCILKLLIFILLILLSPCISIASINGNANQNFDIYYLAVGSSYYKNSGFSNLEGSNKSAKKVAYYLDRSGATSGIVLVSDEDKLVTKNDVLTALDNLLTKIKSSKPQNPLVVFYFCGHGISEGIGWNHFSIPGDFDVKLEDINIDTLIQSAIYASEISDTVKQENLPCLLLLDSCYNLDKLHLSELVFSKQLANNLEDIFKQLRYINEFHDGPTMTVFSTPPGTKVGNVQDPIELDAPLSVGPIARRLMLSFERAFKLKRKLTITEFLQQMSDSAFDTATPTVLTLSTPSCPDTQLITYPLSDSSKSERRFGTNISPKINILKNSTTLNISSGYVVSPDTYLLLQSDPNEYIGEGKRLNFSAKDFLYKVVQDNPDHISIEIEEGDFPWIITFTAPDGEVLHEGSYKNAQRSSDSSHPGFEITGASRGCNDIDAQFIILRLKRDAEGKLVELDADRAIETLRGQLRFRAIEKKSG